MRSCTTSPRSSANRKTAAPSIISLDTLYRRATRLLVTVATSGRKVTRVFVSVISRCHGTFAAPKASFIEWVPVRHRLTLDTRISPKGQRHAKDRDLPDECRPV